MGKPIPETPTIVATSANTYKIEESSFKIEESETSKKVIAGINQGNFIPGGSLSIDEKEEDVKMKDVKTEVPEGQNEPQVSI
uniref:Uncharacterized protein n=1 Tax=Acrobeloides nanus TaxID=290746 RepID=A0A914DD78_9BILA